MHKKNLKYKQHRFPPFNLSIRLCRETDEDKEEATAYAQHHAEFNYGVYVTLSGTPNTDMYLVCHEASHLSDFYFADIGEDKPSDEFKAYIIGSFVSYIVQEMEKMGEKSKVNKPTEKTE